MKSQHDHDRLFDEISSKLNELGPAKAINNENFFLKEQIRIKDLELKKISESLSQFETHSIRQNEIIEDLVKAAERKIIELKVALDKKTYEAKNYYNHMQQALSQVALLKEENAAIRNYIERNKL